MAATVATPHHNEALTLAHMKAVLSVDSDNELWSASVGYLADRLNVLYTCTHQMHTAH